jgi:hypothetical protein
VELIRITDPFELISVKEKIYPLFEKYYERARHYLENLETPEVAWSNCVTKSIYPDYYFYLIRDGGELVGYYVGCLVRLPQFIVLYTMDYYIPNKGVEFSEVLKQIMTILGADEVWGEAPDNILRLYRRVLKGSTVKKVSMVRIKL